MPTKDELLAALSEVDQAYDTLGQELEELRELIEGDQPPPPPPPPPVPDIIDLDFDVSSIDDRHAPGSDNWAATRMDNGDQLVAWGDGGGFGGTNQDHRVGLGIGELDGDYPGYTVRNINGGKDPVSGNSTWPPTNNAKSYAIISVRGKQYMYVSPGSGETSFREALLWQSEDRGGTWNPATWKHVAAEDVMMPCFLQYGRDHEDNPDGLVYAYWIHPRDFTGLKIQKMGTVYLSRAKVENEDFFTSKDNWAWWDGRGWTTEITKKAPVFEDPEGVG